MRMEWIANSQAIAGHKRAARNAQRAFGAVLGLLHGSEWRGACHASSVITYIALKEMGTESALVLGEAAIGPVHFDHSWIEVDALPIDSAVSLPLNPVFSANPVFLGKDVATKLPTRVVYRASTGGLDPEAKLIAENDMGWYFDNFDAGPGGFFEPMLMVLTTLGIKRSEDQLRYTYSSNRWSMKI